MRRLFVLCAVLLALMPAAASAQPVCQPGALPTADMAGVYVDPVGLGRIQIGPCGGIGVQWENAYGTHIAGYTAVTVLPGGGYAARGFSAALVDGAYTIGVKPADPGTIKLITVDPYGRDMQAYHFWKTA